MHHIHQMSLNKRFRGFLPVVIDVETGGLQFETDALLEIAAVLIDQDENGKLFPKQTIVEQVLPFEGSRLDPESLKLNKIDPFHPLRFALDEGDALINIFQLIHEMLNKKKCQRAILVGHNSWFDLFFLNAAIKRAGLTNNPFHSFSSLDTVSLGALYFGHTVLAKSCELAGITFDKKEAHSALYDAEKTAELFCLICNKFSELSHLFSG